MFLLVFWLKIQHLAQHASCARHPKRKHRPLGLPPLCLILMHAIPAMVKESSVKRSEKARVPWPPRLFLVIRGELTDLVSAPDT